MPSETDNLQALAARVTRGEPGAGEAFRQQAEPYLRVLARRAQRAGTRPTPAVRAAQAEAACLRNQDANPRVTSDALDAAVARRLCDTALDRLQPASGKGIPLRETVVE